MQKVKFYLDEMFQELPKSKRAKELKAEILANMEERYQELTEQNKKQAEIENQLIVEIGTAQEIRENINLVSTKNKVVEIGIYLMLLVGTVFLLFATHNFDISFGYKVVILNVAHHLTYFFGTIFVLNVINLLIRPKEIFVENKRSRIACFVLSVILMLSLITISIHPTISMHLARFVLQPYNVVLIAVLSGILFFLGSRK